MQGRGGCLHRIAARHERDLGQGGDVTSAATIAADARFTAEMNARQALVVAGIEVAAAFFKALDSEVRVELLAKDGDSAERGTTLVTVTHDPEIARRATRVVRLDAGRVVA